VTTFYETIKTQKFDFHLEGLPLSSCNFLFPNFQKKRILRISVNPKLWDMLIYPVNATAAQKKQIEHEYNEHNKRVMDELKRKGFC